MTLFEHLRELRYRLVIAVGAIVIGMIASAVFYSQLFDILRHPYDVAIAALKEKNPDQVTDLVNIGLASPFVLALKVCLVSGLVLTAPIWLYQLWSFIVPGLMAKEKKWAMIFIGTATPLFLAGVATGYIIMPKGIAVLLGFTLVQLHRAQVAELVVALDRGLTPLELRDELARCLGDASLVLCFPTENGFVDQVGDPVTPGGSGRSVTRVEHEHRLIALLEHRPALAEERELLAATTACSRR